MSPWIDDPETGTSHYERPKRRRIKPAKGSLAELAEQHNAAVTEALKTGEPEESFGQRMARLKREKRLDSLEVQGS